MRLGWAVTTDHFVPVPGRDAARVLRAELSLLCMGLFSRFFVGALRCTEERPRTPAIAGHKFRLLVSARGTARVFASSASGHGNSKMQFIKCYLMVQLNDQAYFTMERFHCACPSGGGWPLSRQRGHAFTPKVGGAVRLSQGKNPWQFRSLT
jgi:hypothetical protein